jgi:hypothetical protein
LSHGQLQFSEVVLLRGAARWRNPVAPPKYFEKEMLR